ncbi:alpha/beta fold hydrolase [Candidatus Woesearchaeota archaeon]|nr:alpha/beta fold hydrolase [Candidatus Woesearchaeota archaeon]
MQIPVKFKNDKGLLLHGFVHKHKKHETAIIFLHGFPGNMFGTAVRVFNLFSKLGYLCFRFEFSGTNTSEGKFENKLMSQEVKEVKCAIDFLENNFPFKKLVLIGHSTGAIDAALYAHQDQRINKLILMGGVSDLKHAVQYDFTDQQVHDFWTKGYITYQNPDKWYHKKRLKKAFYDEFFTLDLPKAMKKYHGPLLIVHGSKDEAVPVKEAYGLYHLAHKPKRLAIIRGADHRFIKKRHQLQLLWQVYRFIRKR